MVRQKISNRTKVAWMVLSVVIMVLGYSYLSYSQHVKNPLDATIPSWGQMYDGMLNAMVKQENSYDGGWLLTDLTATGIRIFFGFLFSVIGGVLLGVLMGSSDHIKAFLTFPVAIGTNTPPTVVVAIFFIVVGIGLKFHMAVLLLGIIPSLTMGVNLVFREFPDELKHKAYMLGNSNFEVIERNFKFSLPKIIENVRAQVGNTIIFLMASEMQLSAEGMGYRIRLHSKIPDMAVVYPYLFLLILLGYLFKLFLKQSIDWVSPWFNLKEEK